jgi:hypothetical protein
MARYAIVPGATAEDDDVDSVSIHFGNARFYDEAINHSAGFLVYKSNSPKRVLVIGAGVISEKHVPDSLLTRSKRGPTKLRPFRDTRSPEDGEMAER